MSASERYALQRAGVEHAIENEMDAFTTEQVRDMRGYVAETIAWRLRRDGFLTPARVLEGDWETVRDALDALPMGAQIRWQEGYPLHSFVGMKTTSVFGDTRWSSVGSDGSFDHLSSTGIAHNDSPIEVIA